MKWYIILTMIWMFSFGFIAGSYVQLTKPKVEKCTIDNYGIKECPMDTKEVE